MAKSFIPKPSPKPNPFVKKGVSAEKKGTAKSEPGAKPLPFKKGGKVCK